MLSTSEMYKRETLGLCNLLNGVIIYYRLQRILLLKMVNFIIITLLSSLIDYSFVFCCIFLFLRAAATASAFEPCCLARSVFVVSVVYLYYMHDIAQFELCAL